MGCCSSEVVEDKRLNSELNQEKRQDETIKKLLFLGAGGSGKTTIFKQLRKIHGEGWDYEFLLSYTGFIHIQIVEQMQLAIDTVAFLAEKELTDQHGDDYKAPGDFNPYHKLSSEAQSVVSIVKKHNTKQRLSAETGQALKVLWNEEIIKDVYENRATTKLDDTVAYFWDKIDEIMMNNYVPNEEDILFVRFRSTGVQEMKFDVKKVSFHMFDVGGQKSERKKWIHCFENVTAVIFVVSLSCYDEVMFEDDTVNSMVDSLELFESIINNEWLKDSSMILFLNKKDLFVEKLSQFKPITLCQDFEDYEGDNTSFEQTTAYISAQFKGKYKAVDGGDKTIYTHVTCATDKDNIHKVFVDVQSIVIGNTLSREFII